MTPDAESAVEKAASSESVRSLVLNGDAVTTAARTLAELLEAEGYGQSTVATAVNGDFVPAAQRAEYALADGDQIEVVSPRQGG